MDDVDRILADAGARWRESLRPAPDVTRFVPGMRAARPARWPRVLVAAAALGIVVVGAWTLISINRPPGPAIGARPATSQPSGTGLPAGARRLALDASVGGCVGSSQDRLAVLRVAEAMDFHAVFPFAGKTPELEKVGALEIVVYKDGWPGLITGRVILGKPGTTRERTAGTWDVCVRAADGGTIEGLPYVVYGDIPMDGSPIKP